MEKECKVKLMSSDNETFEVEQAVALQSPTIKIIIEDTGMESAVPLPNVSSKMLAKVIDYCKFHVHSQEMSSISEEESKVWDQKFVEVDLATLFDLILAANYLDIKPLLDLTCQTVADMIKGKSPEEIRKMFNIKNDFTPDEEEQVRRENEWAFQ